MKKVLFLTLLLPIITLPMEMETEEINMEENNENIESNLHYSPIVSTNSNSDGYEYVDTLEDHTDRVYTIVFNPQDSNQLISSSLDGTVKIWDIKKKSCKTFGGERSDLAHMKMRNEISTQNSNNLAINSNGKTIAFSYSGYTLTTLDSETALSQKRFAGSRGDCVEIVAFHPKKPELLLASSYKTKHVHLWDTEKGKHVGSLKLSKGHTEANLFSFAVNPSDVTTLVTGHRKKTCIWDMEKQKKITSLKSISRCILFHPTKENIFISTSGKQKIRIFNSHTKEKVETIALNGYGWGDIWHIALNPNGKEIVVTSQKLSQVWDLGTRKLIQKLPNEYRILGCCTRAEGNHSDFINNVAISFDGHTLATCSDDRTIKIWEK